MTKMTWLPMDPGRLCLADLGARKHLPHEATLELVARARDGDRAAFDDLVLTNGRLVINIASKYDGPVPLADRCQEGVVGLMRAVEKFDPEKGIRFSTYATFWIRQAVQRAAANHDRRIRIPVHMADRARRVMRVEAEMAAELGRKPTPEEMAEVLPLSAKEIRSALRSTVDAASLDEIIGDDGWSVEDTIPSGNDTEEKAGQNLLGDVLVGYLDRLSAREARIICMRFGLDVHEPMTLEQIGARFGLTRERIRQLLQEALVVMREWAEEDFGR